MKRSISACLLIISFNVSSQIRLNGDWNKNVKKQLENLIARQAGSGRKVIFDFDNTMICRDIGEATFAYLSSDHNLGKPLSLSKKSLLNKHLEIISPSFQSSSLSLDRGVEDITQYYENLLSSSKHQNDYTPYVTGYAWVVQIMMGFTPLDIINSSKAAYNGGSGKISRSKVLENGREKDVISVGKSISYRRPYFYPEMVELVAVLIKNGYEVWFISASNVWTVRYMVIKELNKKLEKEHRIAKSRLITGDKIIGVSTLLRAKSGDGFKLYKDPELVRENPKYAALEANELEKYRLTTQVVYPLTGYYGKSANIIKWITAGKERPYLVAGDSPNDFAMLQAGENRLWLARLEKSGYQKKLVVVIGDNRKGWLIQPTLYKKMTGFIANKTSLTKKIKKVSASVVKSLEILKID